ncbi:MAG: hypothetical protein AAB599_03120 [Patescibacteria group bacterium]
MSQKIGKVIHYYDKIGVAIVKLDEPLIVGTKVRFSRGGEDLFDQTIESLQEEHKNLESAKAGDEIGIKVDEKVKEGAEVFRVE